MYSAETGYLMRRYRQGEAAIPGFLDDYALVAQGLLDLYEAQFDLRHLQLAVRLTEKQRELFEDRKHGGFFSTDARDSSLVMRMKEDYDGAEPSGNSVAALNLLRLAQMTGRAGFRESAERLLAAFGPRLIAAPVALPQMLVACEFFLGEPREIVLVGAKGAADTEALARTVREHFGAGRVVLLVDTEETRACLAAGNPGHSIHGPRWTAAPRPMCAGIMPASCRWPRLAHWPSCYNKEFTKINWRNEYGKTWSNDSEGQPLTLIGPELKAGDTAPDFSWWITG